MARFLSGLFGSNKQTQPPATALRVNTSLQGVPIALLLGGANRLGTNLLDWFNFFYENAQQSGGGKGGSLGGGGKGANGNYDYFVSAILGVCEALGGGTIGEIWANGTGVPPLVNGELDWGLGDFPAEVFPGDYAQLPWGFISAVGAGPSNLNPGVFAAHALAYRGVVYAAFGNVPLGSSTSLPNLTFGVQCNGNSSNVVPGQPDGDASIALAGFLTNQYFGVGLPSLRLGSLTQWQQYCLALGLAVSPVLASATQASSFINDLVAATNAAACWQDGSFTVVPYGDAAVSAGEISTSVETYEVPPGTIVPDPPNPNLEYPVITVSFAGTFAGDGGVTYQSGGALTRVTAYAPSGVSGTGSPAQGQYYVSNGVYYFNVADIGQTIIITYQWAATGSYVPDTTPIYDFTIDDCLPNQLSIGQGLSDPSSPFMIVRKPRDQMLNNIKVEYLDRNNTYNPVDIEVKDEASITVFKRERPSEIKQLHFFCLAGAAQQSATLSLIRQGVARTAQWTVGRHFGIILQLMALVTISDPAQGLDEAPFRIIEIQENSDFSLTITAEEFLGTVSAPLYGTQPNQGTQPNYNADPGGINPPIIFEPTDELNQTNSLGDLQVWAAISGANLTLWGGAYVWASYDGENYSKVGVINGAARMGVLTSELLSVAVNPTGQTIDTADIVDVNLSESAGTLSSGTQADALALNTRCYVGPADGGGAGEIIAFETAALTAANAYALSYLVRGAYGTESAIATWPAGTPFARLDNAVFALAYDQSRIGATLHLKFQSFNVYEGGLQNLSECVAYQYTLTGAALSSPLPDVQNLRTVFDVNSGFTELVWDGITDFRAFSYRVRTGSSAASAMTLSEEATSPFRVPGDGTYWVDAIAQPAPGLTVYSETPADVAISGAVITQNVVLTLDLKAENWPGTFTGGAGIDSTLDAIRTGGGNILADASILTTSDILDYGGGSSGAYFPVAFLDIGYVANASVAIAYQPTGIPVGQNILAIGNILATPDILGSASTAFITVYPQIATATATGGDLYSVGDLYQYPDLYTIADYNWSAFQKFAPGTYQARALDFAMVLDTIDPNTIAYDLEFKITITIPSRIDTYSETTSTGGATALTFQTNSAAAPFNGGPATGNLPAVQGTIIGAQAGDQLVITSVTLAGLSYEVTNGGTPVARAIILTVQGY